MARPAWKPALVAGVTCAAAVRDKCARVFAAGDVRYGSVKRVAGAVGEGSVTVGSVHRYL